VSQAAVVALVITIAFLAAVAFAAITGIGLIVPILRASHVLIGRRRAEYAAREFGPVESLLVAFLHVHPGRLTEVLVLEACGAPRAHLRELAGDAGTRPRLVLDRRADSRGRRKVYRHCLRVHPGQLGASEGVYALLTSAIGLPTAAGLTLALVRRMRELLIAAAGVFVLSSFGLQGDAKEMWS
jgi:hypothetical protein